MTLTRQALGIRGEALACAHLEARGWRILGRRVRLRAGEIDIVAHDGTALVFVEVKARADRRRGAPAEAVTARKQQRLALLALTYVARHRLADTRMRFDVVAVEVPSGGEPSVTLIQDAFRPGW